MLNFYTFFASLEFDRTHSSTQNKQARLAPKN